MLSVKGIQFHYPASADIASLLEDFRLMCNDAIRVALQYEKEHGEKVKSRFKLQELAHPRLKEYSLYAHYIHSACEVAYPVYRNKNRKSDPYVKRAFLKLDNESYRPNHLLLRIPFHSKVEDAPATTSTSPSAVSAVISDSSTTRLSKEARSRLPIAQ